MMTLKPNTSLLTSPRNSLATHQAKPVRHGFTLIELLVVIAIIALLAAILFPVFGRARENARRSSCTSNVKQIMLAVMQYTQDYDEYYPLSAMRIGGSSAAQVNWPQVLQPYTKSEQVFQCPSDDNTNTMATAANPAPNGYPDPFHTSYGAMSSYTGYGNGLFGTANSSSGTILSPHMAKVASPATTIAVADSGIDWKGNGDWVVRTTERPKSYVLVRPNYSTHSNDFSAPSDRHLDTVVVGFADGHVKTMKLSQFFYGSPVTPWYDVTKGGS